MYILCMYIHADHRHIIHPLWKIHTHLISCLFMESIRSWKDGSKGSWPQGSFPEYLTLVTKTIWAFPSDWLTFKQIPSWLSFPEPPFFRSITAHFQEAMDHQLGWVGPQAKPLCYAVCRRKMGLGASEREFVGERAGWGWIRKGHDLPGIPHWQFLHFGKYPWQVPLRRAIPWINSHWGIYNTVL